MTTGSSTKTASQNRVLITLNRLCAVLGIGAAILLFVGEKSLHVPGLAAAPHHEPLIAHGLLTALLLFMANARLKGEDGSGWTVMISRFLIWFSIAALALIDLWLGGKALFGFDPSTAFAILLLVPGLLCGWSYFALLAKSDEEPPGGEPEADDESEADGPDDRTLIAAAQTQSAPGLTLRANFLYGLAFIVGYGVIFAIMVAAFPWYYMIERAIFEQRFLGWASFLKALPAAFEAALPYYLALAAVMFGIYAWHGVTAALRERRDRIQYRDINRQLTPEDLSLIDTVADQLAEYADSFRRGWLYNTLALAVFLLSFGGLALLGFLLAGDQSGLGAALFESERTRGLDWYIYVDEFGIGDVLTIFSAIMVSGSILSFLGTVWKNFGIAGILDYRRDNDNPEDAWSYYRQAAALEVRRGNLKTGEAFDPASFIQRDYRRFAGGWYRVTVVMIAVNLLFLYLDRMDYDLLTEDRIETTDYWTSKVHRLTYDDVEAVEVACAESEDEDEDDLELAYRLILDGDRRIDAIDLDAPGEFRSILPERLDAWTRIDAKLRAAGVPVRAAFRTTKRGRRSRFNERECIAGLDDLLGDEVRKNVMPLLRTSG